MRRSAFMLPLLTVLGARYAFGAAQIWDLGEGISAGATSDGQVACIRYGANLNKAAIWSVQYGFKDLGKYIPRGITWKGSQLVVAAHTNGVAYRWNGNIQGVGNWQALPLADGQYSWQPHRVQAMASDGSNVWVVGLSTNITTGAQHACVYTDNGSTSACVNITIPTPGHDHSEMCAVAENGLAAGQAQYGGGGLTSGGRQVITGDPLRFLGNLLGNPTSANEARALAISGDATRITGWSYISLSPLYIQQCYWDAPFTANLTAHPIPFLPDHVWGDATTVSRTGTYIGGASWKVIYNPPGQVNPEGQAAWIWDAAHGTRNLKDVLTAEGADLTGWSRLCDDLSGTAEHGDGFFDIAGISEDGRWITGTGAQSGVRHAYVAYLNEAPTVTGISPSTGINTGTVQVAVSGLVFRAGATVKLTKPGQPNIGAFNVNVNSLSSITCRFNLAGKTPSQWDVVVTNSDGLSGSLDAAFFILQPGGPYFLPPTYQATNILLTLTNTGANDLYDLLTATNLNVTNWTFLMRGTNGQTRFSVTNPPPFESYYRAAATNR
jgi:hypothetical protein